MLRSSGARIALRKAGNSYKARCPFHDEKTPSFNVRPDKGFYHCFGCGAHGDAISFVREFDNLGFTEAVEELAKQAGLEVPYDNSRRQEIAHSRGLTEALDFAAQFYQRMLREHPGAPLARDYLNKRGLSADIIQRFGLGFAPPEGDALARAAAADLRQSLLDTGTISDRYGRPRDLLRNRIVFPIRNTRGRTVAFGGRTLGDDKAKYINSPESDVFHKSREVYGLHEAQQANRRLDRLLVVEGYMDVIALAQFGINFAVAALGTATNTENISSLLRQVRHLVFCFDGDQAGFRAAERALTNSLELLQDGIHIQFLMLPQGEDPDTLVRQEGPDAFLRRIDQATPLSRFLFQRHSEGLNLTLPEHRGELRARCEPLLNQMPRSTLREAMWTEMMRLCGRNQDRGNWQNNRNERGSRKGWRGGKGNWQQNDGSGVTLPMAKPDIRLDRDTMLCLALLEAPELADEVLALPLEEVKLPKAGGFARWVQSADCQSREDIFSALAFDAEAHRRFYTLFDGIEHLPERDRILADARAILQRAVPRASSVLGLINSPSELSAEAKETLRRISRQKAADQQSPEGE